LNGLSFFLPPAVTDLHIVNKRSKLTISLFPIQHGAVRRRCSDSVLFAVLLGGASLVRSGRRGRSEGNQRICTLASNVGREREALAGPGQWR
jgi:hypothetical protein